MERQHGRRAKREPQGGDTCTIQPSHVATVVLLLSRSGVAEPLGPRGL